MPNINVASPSDAGIVATYPADERASRQAILDLFKGAAFWGGTTGGSSSAYTATVDNTGWALSAGGIVTAIVASANSVASPTLDVNGTGAKVISFVDTSPIPIGVIRGGQRYLFLYDGTRWIVLNPHPWRASIGAPSSSQFNITGVPANTTKISITVDDLSTNGSSNYLLQLGDVGGIETSGYQGNAVSLRAASTTFTNFAALTGFAFKTSGGAATAARGRITLEKKPFSTEVWDMQSIVTIGSEPTIISAGNKTLTSVLTQIRIRTENGADIFDGGSIQYRIE